MPPFGHSATSRPHSCRHSSFHNTSSFSCCRQLRLAQAAAPTAFPGRRLQHAQRYQSQEGVHDSGRTGDRRQPP
jgi:hypothetical protein